MRATRLGRLLVLAMGWVWASCGPAPESMETVEPEDATGWKPEVRSEVAQDSCFVPLGDGAFELEVLLNGTEGSIQLLIWDRGRESMASVRAEAIELRVSLPGQGISTLILSAVANPRRGATVGDTPEFFGEASWLVGASALQASIPRLNVRGTVFKNIALYCPGNGGSSGLQEAE